MAPTDIDPGPFYLPAGETGILLVHGLTATPTEMILIGRYLHDNGLTVYAPLLPGHGTTPADCNRYRWQHWANYVTVAFAELQDKCRTVFVGGLSMGSLLSLVLAARMPAVRGVMTYAPAIKSRDGRQFLAPLIKPFKRTIKKSAASNDDPEIAAIRQAYDVYPTNSVHELQKLQGQVRRLLPEIVQPILIVYSAADPRIQADGIDYLIKNVGSSDKEVLTLQESGHIITLDKEWEMVAEKSLQFIDSHR